MKYNIIEKHNKNIGKIINYKLYKIIKISESDTSE